MLTESQKLKLENHLYKIIKESLLLETESDDNKNTNNDNKAKTVLKWLRSDQENNAAICRQLWPDMNGDTARSLFSKKLRGHDADGKSYQFSEDEINTLYNMKDRYIDKIS